MKTTNYEISKKLKEIGFETETIFHYEYEELRWEEEGVDLPFEDLIYAYDLETIWGFLPSFIKLDTHPHNLEMKKGCSDNLYIGYGFLGYEESIIFTQERGESLADTAARLLIKLIEDKIIKIK